MSISEFSLHRNIKVFIFEKYNFDVGCFQLDLSVFSQASVITSQIKGLPEIEEGRRQEAEGFYVSFRWGFKPKEFESHQILLFCGGHKSLQHSCPQRWSLY